MRCLIRYLIALLLLSFITITANAEGWYVVTADALNIRTAPSTNSEVIAQLSMNDSVYSLEEPCDGWMKIDYNGMEAYVSTAYVTFDEINDSPAPNDNSWYTDLDVRVEHFLTNYRFDIPRVNNLVFTIAIACLIVALFILSRKTYRLYTSNGRFTIAHLLAIIIAILVIWQALSPKDGVFMNNIIWFFNDHSWLRKIIYFISFATAIYLYGISIVRLFLNGRVMPSDGGIFWMLGLASWPVFIIILILCEMFGGGLGTVTLVFLGLQVLFIIGMFIYHANTGHFISGLLLIPSYLITSLGFTTLFAIFIALAIVIAIVILVGYGILSAKNGDIHLRWSSSDGCYVDDEGNRYNIR